MTAADLDWMLDAGCRTMPEFTEQPQLLQRRVCEPCPVRSACKEYALSLPQPYFSDKRQDLYFPLYGGLTALELRRLAKIRQQRAKAAA